MTNFPFTAIIGQDQFKLALALNMIDPSLGGVLAIGDKGTGKTTLIRSLSDLMHKPFVNLPIGASEDRVLGHINLEKLINEKKEITQIGLLGQANKGFLYIDEVNLLNDYLMNLLLDASASGTYFLEREGISKKIQTQFCLIGSMNPEEGDLRPQLKDRFGLSVNIATSTNIEERVSIVMNRLAFDENSSQFLAKYKREQEELYQKIVTAQSILFQVKCSQDVFTYCAEIALKHAVEGMRADILLIKTSRAYAAYHKREQVTIEDVQAIQEFVLNHRRNQLPPQESSLENSTEPPTPQEQEETNTNHQQDVFQSVLPQSDVALSSNYQQGVQQNSENEHSKITVDRRKTVGQYLATDQFELMNKSQEEEHKKQVVFLLDSSGSMRKDQVIMYAKGLIKKMLAQHQHVLTEFSLVSLYQGSAELLMSATSDTEKYLEVLEQLKTGGKTDIVAGFKKVKELTTKFSKEEIELVIITDGHFCAHYSIDEIVLNYQFYCKKIQSLTLVDTETGIVKLGLVQQIAQKLKGTYESLLIE